MAAAGQGSISFSQKQTGGGPPFAGNAADNGLSVDPVTGKIVLGNDFLAAGDPAALLNTRQIPLNGFDFIMTSPGPSLQFVVGSLVGGFQSTLQSSDRVSSVVLFDGVNGNQANLEAINNAGTVFISVGADGTNGHFNINAVNQLNYFLNFTPSLNNHAGAAAGTLNNAPVVGDPVKWIGINDNGVLRRIPTW